MEPIQESSEGENKTRQHLIEWEIRRGGTERKNF